MAIYDHWRARVFVLSPLHRSVYSITSLCFVVFAAFDNVVYPDGNGALWQASAHPKLTFSGTLVVVGADADWNVVDLAGGHKNAAVRAAIG